MGKLSKKGLVGHVAKRNSGRQMNVYANLAHKRKTKKDLSSRKRAEYLASLPKHPVQRVLYRLHPKRVAQYWFSKRGALMAVKIFGVLILLGVLSIGALFAYYRKDLDQIRPSELAKRVQTTVSRYYDRNGNLLWEDKGSGNYTLVVKSDEINKYMKEATVAIEDKDFYRHGGISISGIARAGISNLQGDSTQGGSTLTQQLVKQVFFSSEAANRGLSGLPRKIKEMILAIEVERMYSKDEILTLYLNESPYGGRRNGVESAAETYFGIKAKDLTLAQAALLASIPNEPGLYNPYTAIKDSMASQALIARQHKVLDRMVQQKYITQSQADEAKAVNILDTVKKETSQYQGMKAPHFVQMVRSELVAKLGEKTVGDGGLTIKTTLDLRIQNDLQKNMKNVFSSPDPQTYGFSNGAAVVEDVRTGQIVALQGSRDYEYPGFGQDNAATAFIQPGSSIKPLVYAQLFTDHGPDAQNFGSGSILADTRTTFPSADGVSYTPQDADGGFRGNINIRQSLDLSRNIPAIKAMAISGIQPTWNTIRALGDTYYCTQGSDKQAGLSSAIGGCGTRMVDHVNALASLGRLGTYRPQTSVLEVKNSSGQVLEKYHDESKKVIDPQAAYIVNDILGDHAARLPLYGSSITPTLDADNIHVAVKTGTSNTQYGNVIAPKDVWTMVYSPSLSVGVWFGNPTPKPLAPFALGAYSAKVADPVMAYASKLYYKEGFAKSGEWFKRPAGIQTINGQIYPSYYNKNQAMSSQTMTFDKVSKRLATKCTPESAQIKVPVTKTTDPYTKKVVYAASDGYDATKKDNVHSCDDVEPSISGILTTDSDITVNVTKGTFALDKVSIVVDGQTITKSVSGNSVRFLYKFTKDTTVRATVTDKGDYSSTASAQYTGSGNGNH